LEILYTDVNAPGRWHDSHVLRESTVFSDWNNPDPRLRKRPINGAVILGDSAYPCLEWLIPPFRGNPMGEELLFNNAHAKVRNTVERCFGVLKKRFYALATTLRVRDMQLASKLIVCAMILHNKCIAMGDRGEDFMEQPDLSAMQVDWHFDHEDNDTAGQQRRRSLVQSLCQYGRT